jgi:hypothetical protein
MVLQIVGRVFMMTTLLLSKGQSNESITHDEWNLNKIERHCSIICTLQRLPWHVQSCIKTSIYLFA